jgi:hypothetical protein
MSNMPAGVTAILPASITGRGFTPRIGRCEVCERDVEHDRDNGKWYFQDSTLRECTPTWVGKAFLCSDRCQSQHLWNIGTDKDRELLAALARLAHAWMEEGVRPDNHDWCVQHLHSGLVVDRLTLRMVSAGMEELLRSLAGEDEYPEWFANAVGPLAPDVEMVRKGLGVTTDFFAPTHASCGFCKALGHACVSHEKGGAA